MCEGELRQVESRGDFELSEDQYFDIIARQDGRADGLLLPPGGPLRRGRCRDRATPSTRYGLHLGVSFQITDDLLDVVGDEATVGKSLGTDLLKQKSTLPVIRLLEQLPPDVRGKLIAQLRACGQRQREILRPYWDATDAVAYAREKAVVFSQLAGQQLDILPPSEARDSLLGLAEFVVSRQH